LGNLLGRQGKGAEAEAAYHRALALRPSYVEAHYNLGVLLKGQRKLVEAEAAYRRALDFRPNFPEALCNPRHALLRQGRFAEALDPLKRGHELGHRKPGWRHPSADWIQEATRLLALERKLPAILQGEAEPADATEQLDLADLCLRFQRLYVAAARF